MKFVLLFFFLLGFFAIFFRTVSAEGGCIGRDRQSYTCAANQSCDPSNPATSPCVDNPPSFPTSSSQLPTPLPSSNNVNPTPSPTMNSDSSLDVIAPSLNDDNTVVKIWNQSLLPNLSPTTNPLSTPTPAPNPDKIIFNASGLVPDLLETISNAVNDAVYNITRVRGIYAGICSLAQICTSSLATPNSLHDNSRTYAQSERPFDIIITPQATDPHIQDQQGLGNTQISQDSQNLGTQQGIYSLTLPELSDLKCENYDQASASTNLSFHGNSFKEDCRVPDINARQKAYYGSVLPSGVEPLSPQK